MKFDAFAKKFSQEKEPALVYIVAGAETFFRNKAIQMIRERWSGEQFEAIVFYGHKKARGEEKLSCAQVLDELRAQSLLSARHLVIVRDGDNFLKEIKDDLTDYFKSPNLKSTLVLELESLDKRLKVSQVLKAKGTLIECDTLYETPPPWMKMTVKESELAKWIRSHCQDAYGKTIQPEAVQLLCQRVGNRLFDLDKELEKLSIYTTANRIMLKEVQELVSDYKRSKYWDLSEALLEHNTTKALQDLSKMYQEGVLDQQGKIVHNPRELAITIVAILFNSFYQIAKVKEHLKYSQDLKAVLPEAHPTRLIKLQEAARTVKNPEQKLEQILEADLALKTSGGSPEFILEKLMIQLSH